jgi:hypothetical protein
MVKRFSWSSLTARAWQVAKASMVCIAIAQLGMHASAADAATVPVPANVNKLDCSTYNGGIKPGDVLVLTGRARGAISLSNCRGSASAPIVIRNDTTEAGPLVISQGGDGFLSQCIDCEQVIIDGSGKWSGAPAGTCGASLVNGTWTLGTKACGIVFRCTAGSPQSSLRIAGSSKFVTVKGVEIDGNLPTCKKGIGISVNDHKYVAKAGEWREGIRLLNNYVHGVASEGMYVGPNQTKDGIGDLQLRNNEIAYNYVDNIGCDGINYKSAIAGQSSIHHNYVTNTGQIPRGTDSGCVGTGIALFEAGYTDIHSNYVEAPSPVANGAGNCIAQVVTNLSAATVGKVPVRIYNNVVRNCKGHGISSGRSGDRAAEPVVDIFNNTVVGPIGGRGVSVSDSISACEVRDNIVAGKTVTAGRCNVHNNSVDSLETQRFRDPSSRDFRLTAQSPAVDDAAGNCPEVDQAGTARPQQGRCDRGAFEYAIGDAPAVTKPAPPTQLSVE